jgi:osmotically-inducible protein OsmY
MAFTFIIFSIVRHSAPAQLLEACLRGAMVLLAVLTIGCGRHDDAIAAESRKQLAANPALRDASISMIVKRGVVLLRGHVVTTSQTLQATAVVARVDGVRTVVSQLTLSDDNLRSAVEQALRQDALLAGVPIEVDVADGVVRLTSTATNATHRSQAIAVAGLLPGVVRVEDNMK